MNGLADSYVESIVKKAMSGTLTAGQAAAKPEVSKQYANRLKRLIPRKGRRPLATAAKARTGLGRPIRRRHSG